MKIRKYTEADAKEICSWRYEKPYHIYNLETYETALKNQRSYVSKATFHEYYVLEEDAIVGYFRLLDQGTMALVSVGLRNDACGQGKGKIVMEMIKEQAKMLGYTKLIAKIRSFNQRAIKVFLAAGFEAKSEKEIVYLTWENQALLSLYARLNTSSFRASFALKPMDKAYVLDKGYEEIMQHGLRFIQERLAPALPKNDGKQTPMKGHPIFIAQHACACCCRNCLSKWHHIEKGRALDENETHFIVQVLIGWIRRQMSQ